jgi:hypothetical protein
MQIAIPAIFAEELNVPQHCPATGVHRFYKELNETLGSFFYQSVTIENLWLIPMKSVIFNNRNA